MIWLVIFVFALVVGAIAVWVTWDRGLWDFIVRFRTWLLGVGSGLLLVLPDLMAALPDVLRSPELTAVLSPEVRKWVALAALILMVWSRWRPASRADDPEVKARIVAQRTADATGMPVPVLVQGEGGHMAPVGRVEPKGRR